MKVALLGADVESLRLAAAAAAAGHEIVTPRELAGGLRGATPEGGEPDGWWESLLDPATCDAVIVGRGSSSDELQTRQLQELVRLERPVLATFPLFGSVLTFFEIDMVRTECDGVLQHFNPLVEPAAVEEAAQWVGEGHPEWGKVEQVVASRSLATRSREAVLWHFARDVELLDRVAGRLDRVGAHAGGSDEVDYSALSVQLLGPAGVPVRWSIEPPASENGLKLSLVFERGRVNIAFDADGRMTLPRGDGAEAAAVERFIAAVESGGAASTWLDALHAMELTDSIEISLRRGRMIDVHHQQLTEHLAFKGTMAAAGCGLLFFLAPLIVAIGWIAGLLGVPIAQFGPHLLLALLAVFLGLQLLPKLLYRDRAEDGE